MRSLALLIASALLIAGCGKEEQKEEAPSREEIVLPEETAPVVKKTLGLIRTLEETDPKVRIRVFDVKEMTADALEAKLKTFKYPAETHLWMAGARTWLVAEHATTNAISLAEAMDRAEYDDEDDEPISIPQAFGAYVGTLEEIMPAFETKLEGNVVPEWFVTKKLPDIKWLEVDHGIEKELLMPILELIGKAQVARRLVLEGNMLASAATKKGAESAATDKWAEAFKLNPRDSILLERCYNLRRNGDGFMAVKQPLRALKCYETLVLIDPENPESMEMFGKCCLEIGRLDVGEKAIDRAEELRQ